MEPVALRLSAGGYMLDFRYRILDPGKAGPIVDHSIKPVLVHRESGAEFMVPSPPKVGSLRQTSRNNRPPIEGRVYFVIFANPGRYIEAGDHVDVVIGDFKADNLVVE